MVRSCFFMNEMWRWMMPAAMRRRLIHAITATNVALLLAVALVASAVPAFAQIDRGQISGFVKDQTGGVIPGATVTATDIQTRLTRTVVTDQAGYYVFTALAPGSYDVQVELEGFKKWVKTGVKLDASANVSVEVMLQTGTISESIMVIAQSTPLQTDVALRKTVEAKDIELLSFSGR